MLIILFLLIILSIVLSKSDNESFRGYVIPYASRINRPTRNMSYDLRGEAYYPPLLNLPFDNSSIAPVLI